MLQRALIIGASGGIGAAFDRQLRARGWQVMSRSRRSHGLDITDEDSVAAVLGQIEGPLDLVLVATGILARSNGPEKTIRALTGPEMAHLFAVNAVGPALVLKHLRPQLPRRRRAVFAALSARVGSIGDNGLGGWYSYRASKAALNQLIRTASIELARSHPQLICTALHPGTVATEFTRNYPTPGKVTPDQAAQNLLAVLEGLQPSDTGGFFDWAGKPVSW